jgi:hypothetical protein
MEGEGSRGKQTEGGKETEREGEGRRGKEEEVGK